MNIHKEINQKKFGSLGEKAVINIMYTSGWLRLHFKPVFSNEGLTMQQFNVLRILKGSYPKKMNPGQIKDVMIDASPDLTRLINRLIDKGLVERNFCSDNRRKVEVNITETGLKVLDKINPALEEAMKFTRILSPAEAQTLSDLLDKIRS